MNAPRRRRRIGGLALAIPFLAFAPAGRAEEPAIPAVVPVTPETIPDLPGIPADAATPDRAGEDVVDALPGLSSTPPSAASPSSPVPGSPPEARAPEPAPPAELAPRLSEAMPEASTEPPVKEQDDSAAEDSELIPTGGLRPLAGLPSPQATAQEPAYPSEQGITPSWRPRRKPFTPTEQVTNPPSIHNQARTGAGHVADGAGKVACGFGKMLRGTGQILGSGFHLLGNATENLFGAGDHLMSHGGHKLFHASQEVAPGLGSTPVMPPTAEPASPPPPRIVPSSQYAAPQSPY